MSKKQPWTWVILFILGAALLGVLATGWNLVLVRDYHRMVELARERFSATQEARVVWWNASLGTLGFLAAMGIIVIFFVRLLKEMQLNELQSEFLATISHELKTPIASLELTSSLIRSGELSYEETEKLWQSHGLELKRLREEVEVLLEAARWQAKSVPISKVPIVLENWISESMDRWKRILGPSAEIVREGESLPFKMELDARMLNLIADNLVDNARKFASQKPRLTIRTLKHRNKWFIEFQDDGRGFDPSDAKKIFGRFFRSRTNAPYAIPGTGLGLYIAGSASRALGLKLSGASNGFGNGARFVLEGTSR